MTIEQTYELLSQIAPNERPCSDEEHEAGPDFAGIAERLDLLDHLGSEGWWADWDGCMYAENILRDFGPLVQVAAWACNEGCDGRPGIYTTFMVRCADSYLAWEESCASSDDEERLIREARRALAALGSHYTATAKVN